MTAWYVQRGDRVLGPFPEKTVFRDLVLGRVAADDSVSRDGETWVRASDCATFAGFADVSVSAPAFAQYDERQRERRDGSANAEAAKRRTGERRRDELKAVVDSRGRSRATWDGLRRVPERQVTRALLVAFVLATLIALAVWFQADGKPPSLCQAAAAPGVKWQACVRPRSNLRHADLTAANLRNGDFAGSDFAGATLSRADLSYADLGETDLTLADLRGARLLGVNLADAALEHADLRGADLRYADLSRARLENANFAEARLDHAIWPSGAECAPGSIGECHTRTTPH